MLVRTPRLRRSSRVPTEKQAKALSSGAKFLADLADLLQFPFTRGDVRFDFGNIGV